MSTSESKQQGSSSVGHVLHDLLLSGIAGTICRIPTHPLDTCKTVAFSSDAGKATVQSAARRIYQREGVRGFYRGLGITVAGAFPGNALYFVMYDWAKGHATKLQENSQGWVSYVPSPFFHLGCGFAAEIVSCAVWVPVDVIKERLQAQGPEVVGRYVSSWDGLRTCMRTERLRGLYKGYFSTLASFGPFSAVYFTFYELFDKLIAPLDFDPFTRGLIAAFLGNSCSAVVTNPLELIKTRLQIQAPTIHAASGGGGVASERVLYGYKYTGVLSGVRAIAKLHGVSGLWRGSLSRVIFTGPNAALTMGCYRGLQGYFPYSVSEPTI